jgi:hypothetical protein
VLLPGNRNKLSIALALVRALAPTVSVPMRVLFDSWFMLSTITRIDGLFCTILEGSLNLAVLGRRVESVRRPVGVIRPDQKGGALSGNRWIGQSGVESS